MMSITLENLAKLGASMIVDAEGMMNSALESIAKKCAESGAKLYIKNAHKLMSIALESIAKAGKGNVTFDFSNDKKK